MTSTRGGDAVDPADEAGSTGSLLPARRRPRPGPGDQPTLGAAVPGTGGTLAAWASLEPTGVARALVTGFGSMPAVELFERRVAAPLEARLFRFAFTRARALLERSTPVRGPLTATERFAVMIEQSLQQSPRTAMQEFHLSLLEQLLPDELRIVGCLTGGAVYPLIHVTLPGRSGGEPVYLLRNASSVGRMAGVTLPQRTPEYVARLVALGLANVAPEGKGLRDEYQLLLVEPDVLSARQRPGGRLRGRTKVVRRTLVGTSFAQELWDSCIEVAAGGGDTLA